MRLLNYAYISLGTLLYLTLAIPRPPSLFLPTVGPGRVPRPYIFTRSSYTVKYTWDSIVHDSMQLTSHHNFITAVRHAIDHLASLIDTAHASPEASIPGNQFLYEVELDRQAGQYIDNPKYMRFKAEPRYEQLAVTYGEVWVALFGLLSYAEAGWRREGIPVCKWWIIDSRIHADEWVSRGRIELTVMDPDPA